MKILSCVSSGFSESQTKSKLWVYPVPENVLIPSHLQVVSIVSHVRTKLAAVGKGYLISNSVCRDVSVWEAEYGVNMYIMCDFEMNTLNSTNFLFVIFFYNKTSSTRKRGFICDLRYPLVTILINAQQILPKSCMKGDACWDWNRPNAAFSV